MTGLVYLLNFTSDRTAGATRSPGVNTYQAVLSYKADQESLKNYAKFIKNLSRRCTPRR